MTANPGRSRLRDLRSEIGWTQQEMAERLARLAWMERREHVAVNADMIAKWERGAKGVSPRYRELLCHLFRVTPDQLGLKTTTRTTPQTPAPGPDESLVRMLDDAANLLDQLGAAGTALAPHMLHAWNDAAATRRTMLGLLDPAAADPIGHARSCTASLDDLEQLADRYQALYETADPAALLTPVTAHLRMTADALRRDPTPSQRRRLLRNQARVAILAGRLAHDDLGNALTGRAYYALALDSARETDDDRLIALAHGHAAELAAEDGFTAAALDHLKSATDHAENDPATMTWLAGVEAMIHADNGNDLAAREALRRTTNSDLATRTAQRAAAGHVHLRRGDLDSAYTALTGALATAPTTARRLRVLILADLAVTALQAGDAAAACAHAAEAVELLRKTPYATGVNRLRAFRSTAAHQLNRHTLRGLDQQIGYLVA